MPKTDVYFYEDGEGASPVLAWLEDLLREDREAYAKCRLRIERLTEEGNALRRPEADHIERGVFELRARKGRVNYRILYGFIGRNEVVLLHALTKEGEVPPGDVERARDRLDLVKRDRERHLRR